MKRGEQISQLLLPAVMGGGKIRPVTADMQAQFQIGAKHIRDRMGDITDPLTPLATHDDIVHLGRQNKAAGAVIDYALELAGPMYSHEVPEPGEFVVLRTRYKGPNGKDYVPLPKYLPHHVALVVQEMQKDYGSFLERQTAVDTPPRPGLIVESGFRGDPYQVAVLAKNIGEHGLERAVAAVSVPGTSQHADYDQVAIDFTNMGDADGNIVWHDGSPREFEQTPEFEWMLENSPSYGLYLPYFPQDPTRNQRLSGRLVEAWHFRYVDGQATELTDSQNIIPLFSQFAENRRVNKRNVA